MKVLVTGASGYLGRHIVEHLRRGGADVVACYHSTPISLQDVENVQLDFTDADACRQTLKSFSPTAIIHAGALTQTSDCEASPAEAYRINTGGTGNLLFAAAELETPPHFVYISTDLVFDGSNGPYYEDEVPSPIQTYGHSKAAGEALVKKYHGNWTIARSTLIYGPPTDSARCFLDWMIDGIRKGNAPLFADEFRTPVYVRDLCSAVLTILHHQHYGVFHLGGPIRSTRYQFGLWVAEAFGLPNANITKALLTQVKVNAPRPRDVSLAIMKAKELFGYSPTPPEAALREIANAIMPHQPASAPTSQS